MRRAKFRHSLAEGQSALQLVPVSRETAKRFAVYVNLLARWSKVANLISEVTLGSVWKRHIADCAQIKLVAPTANRWVDIGSGAGLPGLVLAMELADVPGAVVHCFECDHHKSAFLREAARATSSPAVVHHVHVQAVDPVNLGHIDAVTARAFASWSATINLAKVWLEYGAVGVFPRGKSYQAQLDSVNYAVPYAIDALPSIVDAEAAIIRVRLN